MTVFVSVTLGQGWNDMAFTEPGELMDLVMTGVPNGRARKLVRRMLIVWLMWWGGGADRSSGTIRLQCSWSGRTQLKC